MIASGGVSSSIAGGNFWDGARQGIITSGLNHLAHSGVIKIRQNKLLREMITEAGYNPDDPATISMEHLMEFVLKVFPEMYERSGKPTFEIVEDGSIGKNTLGDYEAHWLATKDDKLVILKSLNIRVTKGLFKSYFRLGSTVGHELIHTIDSFNGSYLKWYNKFGESIADDFTELNAHEWQISVGAIVNMKRYNEIYYRIHGID